jgi:hypothetical protein
VVCPEVVGSRYGRMEVGVENMYPDRAISGRTIRSTASGVKLLNQLRAVSVTKWGTYDLVISSTFALFFSTSPSYPSATSHL